MADAPNLEFLNEVDEALARYTQVVDAAIDTVLDQQVTDYPILVFQRAAEVAVGVSLIEEANPGGWEVRITTLEELAGKNLLRPERIKEFREVFTDARRRYCLFVISEGGARFAFRPRS